jgi:hypothetical protein
VAQDHQPTVPKVAVQELVEMVVDGGDADGGASFNLLKEDEGKRGERERVGPTSAEVICQASIMMSYGCKISASTNSLLTREGKGAGGEKDEVPIPTSRPKVEIVSSCEADSVSITRFAFSTNLMTIDRSREQSQRKREDKRGRTKDLWE